MMQRFTFMLHLYYWNINLRNYESIDYFIF